MSAALETPGPRGTESRQRSTPTPPRPTTPSFRSQPGPATGPALCNYIPPPPLHFPTHHTTRPPLSLPHAAGDEREAALRRPDRRGVRRRRSARLGEPRVGVPPGGRLAPGARVGLRPPPPGQRPLRHRPGAVRTHPDPR